jgi:hypothetical protein
MGIVKNSNHCAVCVYRKLIFGALNSKELSYINGAKQEIFYKKGELIHDEEYPVKTFMY